MSQQQKVDHQQQSVVQLNSSHDQQQTTNNQSSMSTANLQQSNTALNPSQQSVASIMLQSSQQHIAATAGPSSSISMQQQHQPQTMIAQQQHQQQNVAGVLQHSHQQQQNSNNVINTSSSNVSVPQNSVLMNQSNVQQQQGPGPTQQQAPTAGQQHPQHQTQALLNQGNLMRVTMPMQNIPQGMQNVQTVQSITGVPGMQIQQLQNVQPISNMPQMQNIQQQIQNLPQVQGMQQVSSLQNLQNIQVLSPMTNIPGSQFVAQHQYLPQMFQNQLQAQMVSPAINLQNMHGSSKSPAISIPQQHQQLEVFPTTFQSVQIQPNSSSGQQQQQTALVNGGVGSTVVTKTCVAVTRPSAPSSLQQAAPNLQHQPQQIQGGVNQVKQVMQQTSQQPRPVLIAGVFPGQAASNQAVVNQPKAPVIAQANQPIRFSNQHALVNNNGQIVQPVMSMNQFQSAAGNMSLAQQIFPSQSNAPSILSSQPVYIRTVQQQQGLAQGVGSMVSNVQMKPIRQQSPRMSRPQKNTSPRTIQPKPLNNSVAVSSLPTALVSPKQGNNKLSPLTVTKVVTSATSPRIATADSIVSTIKKGASIVNKALSNHNIAESSTPETNIETKSTALEDPEKENKRDMTIPPQCEVNVLLSVPPPPSNTDVTTIASPLSLLEPKAPPGSDFVVSRTAERKQAIVKPVLTHVIGDFVIQESSEPFPVHRSNVFGSRPADIDMEVDKDNTQSESQSQDGKPRCEICNKHLPAKKKKVPTATLR